MGFSACVILFRHDHFDVITYEKSALYNTGDCLQLFFERRVDVVFPIVDRLDDDRKAELRHEEEHRAEGERHPEQQSRFGL